MYGELMRYSQDLKAERKHVSAKYIHLRHWCSSRQVVFKHLFVVSDQQHLQEGRKTQQYLDQCWKHMDNVSNVLVLVLVQKEISSAEYTIWTYVQSV